MSFYCWRKCWGLLSFVQMCRNKCNFCFISICRCWMFESVYQWVLAGPVCVSIFANLVFLINIVRLLLTKLRGHPSSPRRGSRKDSRSGSRRGNRNQPGSTRRDNPQSEVTRKAIKATIILIPLFGLQYMLIPFRPETGSKYEKIYQILSAVVVSFQVRRIHSFSPVCVFYNLLLSCIALLSGLCPATTDFSSVAGPHVSFHFYYASLI